MTSARGRDRIVVARQYTRVADVYQRVTACCRHPFARRRGGARPPGPKGTPPGRSAAPRRVGPGGREARPGRFPMRQPRLTLGGVGGGRLC